MNRQFNLILAPIFVWVAGCGVKGDPTPTVGSAQIGNGQPKSKRIKMKSEIKSEPDELDEQGDEYEKESTE